MQPCALTRCGAKAPCNGVFFAKCVFSLCVRENIRENFFMLATRSPRQGGANRRGNAPAARRARHRAGARPPFCPVPSRLGKKAAAFIFARGGIRAITGAARAHGSFPTAILPPCPVVPSVGKCSLPRFPVLLSPLWGSRGAIPAACLWRSGRRGDTAHGGR